MKNFIIHDENGNILSTGTCPDGDMKLQPLPGQFVIEGVANDVKHKIVDGKVVEKYPGEQPPQPPIVPYKNRPARISNDGLANLLKDIIDLNERVSKLESEVRNANVRPLG